MGIGRSHRSGIISRAGVVCGGILGARVESGVGIGIGRLRAGVELGVGIGNGV